MRTATIGDGAVAEPRGFRRRARLHHPAQILQEVEIDLQWWDASAGVSTRGESGSGRRRSTEPPLRASTRDRLSIGFQGEVRRLSGDVSLVVENAPPE